ncbi:hypothetical protein KUV62_15805 [Salipiger bermudensis]|uniref:hypothetical protein n=1 Tax=Salipiger bermudensis TaxID=344736 RepID=UPI001C99B849|nr:hypothetical protein [Salipiger bermudensis]MBY6005390.1 hypothetical protein [Salipiger bermudensis]
MTTEELQRLVELNEGCNDEAQSILKMMAASLARELIAARRVVEALEFYADRSFDGYDVEITDYGISMSVGDIIKDGGDKARAALSAYEEAKG